MVEDNDDVGQFSTELLEDLGYTVRRVDNADAALAILAENEFAADLVFSDVIMPGMNGVELAGVIRDRYPGLPVVLTSGYSNVLAENAHRGFELIQKPYSVEALSRIFRKAISRQRPAGEADSFYSTTTLTTPAPIIPSARAALIETSMIRPRMNGPRSLTRHSIVVAAVGNPHPASERPAAVRARHLAALAYATDNTTRARSLHAPASCRATAWPHKYPQFALIACMGRPRQQNALRSREFQGPLTFYAASSTRTGHEASSARISCAGRAALNR